MTTEQVKAIISAGAFPGEKTPAELVETHISWVILTPDYAFKVKKPVCFGFLDFSTPDQRRRYCTEEMRLNRRLAPDLYLNVLPIARLNGRLTIGADVHPVEDYAVQMIRLDSRLQMDRLLTAGLVTTGRMEQLALVLAGFHRKVVMHGAIVYHPGAYWADFAELYRLSPDIERHFGRPALQKMAQWRVDLPAFLERHAGRLMERVQAGFWVDGHGDLHTRNIFLPAGRPVVFDCIEFDPHFRQSDILNELAFLCMDLDARGHPELARVFLKTYIRQWDIFPSLEDHRLFLFFKAYRANVRLKVALLELRQHKTEALVKQVPLYWDLLDRYLQEIIPSG